MNTNINHHQLPSQTQLRIGEAKNKWNHLQQQPKKKRRGGNRSLYRFRKACRAKGLSDQRIKMLIEMHQVNKSMQQPLDRNTNDKNQVR